MKTFLFAVALASLALAGGCATGGNGTIPPPVTIDVAITSPSDANPRRDLPDRACDAYGHGIELDDYGRYLEPERHQLHGQCVRDAHADHTSADPGNRSLRGAGNASFGGDGHSDIGGRHHENGHSVDNRD